MKKQNIVLGLLLIGLSIVLHAVHFVIFKDMHHIMIFLFADIAFIPLEVFFVSLILERLINKQDEEKTLKKMHMLVGLFYQKFGDELLSRFVSVSEDMSCTSEHILMNYSWNKKQYSDLRMTIDRYQHKMDIESLDLKSLFELLKENESLIINLISNPSLQENDIFSDLLLSIFHLNDELGNRDISNIVGDDLTHMEIDCQRVFKLLSAQWVDYMEHLQVSYPYLFLTAALNNPYDKRSKSDITESLMSTKISIN